MCWQTGQMETQTSDCLRAPKRHAVVATSLGKITIVAEGSAVVGLYFPGHWTLPSTPDFGPRIAAEDDELLHSAQSQLNEYLRGERVTFDVPTATEGSELEEQVWALLRALPFGSTTTYGELAEKLGNKKLAQAVGRAVGHNPLSILVGCHRVLGSDGSLTGFAGGLERKRALLELENPNIAAARLF